MKIKSIYLAFFFIIPFLSIGQELSIKLDAVKVSFIADMQNTAGTLSGFKAKIKFNAADLTKSSITGSVDVNTINTGTPKRDEHLKSDDYFDAETYPTMSFKSTSIVETNGSYIMKGMLQIKNVVREETIIFTYINGIFKGETTIQASNFDLGNFVKKGPEKTNVKISFEIPVE